MTTLPADPRRLAWDILRAVEEGAFADAELARRFRKQALDERDRGLATQLVYGTIAWQGLCDHVLETLGRSPNKLDTAVLTLLRLGLFQILKLDRVPDFAVVDTAVDLSKRHRNGGAAGLVNALLRRFLREEKTVRIPPDASVTERLAILYSHPAWMVDLWVRMLGVDDATDLLTANNQPAPTVLRVNSKRTSREDVISLLQPMAARPAALSPVAVECKLRGPLTALPAYRKGLVTAQGQASQLVGFLATPGSSGSVLDACAAPGGKATHIAERGPGGTRITALDRSHSGLVLLRKSAARLGLAVATICSDARSLPLTADTDFDSVLLDAPCSGLGTLRQHPEIRWRRHPRDIRELATKQSSMLAELASHVKPGGTLVYSTCTIVAEENQDRIGAFLHAHPGFTIDDPRPYLPETARHLVGDDGFLRTYPHRDDTDGFFAARMTRKRNSPHP